MGSSLQTTLTVNSGKYMTQCSITYIPLLCLCNVAVSLFLQLHVSREWGCSMVGGWAGGGSMGHFGTDRKCSLLSHDTVVT